MIIQDGKTGYTANVDSSNRLSTYSTTVTAEHHANHEKGKAFTMTFNQSPTAADDCIAFIKNTSEDDMVIEGVTLGVKNCTADDSFYMKLGDTGTPNSGTAFTPVNMNAGSGNLAEGTFEYGADLDNAGAALSGGSEFERYVFAGVTDSSSACYNFPMDVVLPKNRALSMWVGGSATGTYYVTVSFYYA